MLKAQINTLIPTENRRQTINNWVLLFFFREHFKTVKNTFTTASGHRAERN